MSAVPVMKFCQLNGAMNVPPGMDGTGGRQLEAGILSYHRQPGFMDYSKNKIFQ